MPHELGRCCLCHGDALGVLNGAANLKVTMHNSAQHGTNAGRWGFNESGASILLVKAEA